MKTKCTNKLKLKELELLMGKEKDLQFLQLSELQSPSEIFSGMPDTERVYRTIVQIVCVFAFTFIHHQLFCK